MGGAGTGVIVGGAADDARHLLLLLAPPLNQIGELGGCNLIESFSCKFWRTLHGNPALVAVGIRPLQIRIAPWRLRGDVRQLAACCRRWSRCTRLCTHDVCEPERNCHRNSKYRTL